MFCPKSVLRWLAPVVMALSSQAAPVIDPIPAVIIPAGKSLIIPITATVANGRPLSYQVTSSTNGIAVVLHTNNPFWQLAVAQLASASAPGAYQTPFRGGLATVTNVGSLTFMLFPEYAPHTVNVFQGLTAAGFYNSNTIFHSAVSNASLRYIQGGDPLTNGNGALVFTYEDEFHPQAMFSGNGQLGVANAGKDLGGPQFFVTVGAQRSLDFSYPLFGQLVRGFAVLTNLDNTAVDANNRPLADEIIQTASLVADTTDTVLTLTATNVPGLTGTITVIADDGAGGRATNVFAATLVTDTNHNRQPFIYPTPLTSLVGPTNQTLTNAISAVELEGDLLYWFPAFVAQADSDHAGPSTYYLYTNKLKTLTYNVTNSQGHVELGLVPAANYAGPVNLIFDVSYDPNWGFYHQFGFSLPSYDEQLVQFVFGDTPIGGQSNRVTALAGVPLANALLATFTNGVPGSLNTGFTAAINWGDNTTNSGVIITNATGIKGVLGTHTYAYAGTYPVYVQAQSVIGARATVLSYVTVTNQAVPATNLLTVNINGQGTVAPVYTNASLNVGQSYAVTATPSNSWVLINWTDGHGYRLSTSTNFTFTMSQGFALTANFALITQPTLAFVSPTTGRGVTNQYNAPATVTGTAVNNAAIAAVWYQVNAGPWLAATGAENWSFSFTPNYGVTNVIKAYAINNYGYVSPTKTALVKYLAGDVLTLATTGSGTIAPNLNGQLLPLGTNYSLTATATGGFTFINWTGGLTSASAVLNFAMATNLSLTANFADQAAPVLAITNLTAGQRWSNIVFVAQGTVTDNWQVASVLVQLNNGSWTNANPAGGISWAASLNLAPGTNVFSAYAIDNAGNHSATTNRVSFDFVVTNQLGIQMTGLGTVAPNYSNAWLEIGRNYAITSAPAAGFVFTNWTRSTNGSGGATVTGAALQFMMASNLTLRATFVETSAPALSITAPTANQRLTNALATFWGATTDRWGVAGVWYQVNGGAWNASTTTNHWTNWTSLIPLNAGTNTLKAYALNLGGKLSPTGSVSVIASNTFKLQLVLTNVVALSTNGLVYSLQLSPGMNGHIQVSTNLTDWQALTNFSGTNATLTFRDPAATNSPHRFYRAVIP